ncbi:MAG: hypothetical protein KA327_06660 [Pseudarcicella sp.]|nr:hypothetical protein [Pseudarcicella sp.]
MTGFIKHIKTLLLLLFFCCDFFFSQAQIQKGVFVSNAYGVLSGNLATDKQATFWNRTNQNGEIPNVNSLFSLGVGAEALYKKKYTKRELNISAGLRIIANSLGEPKILLPEAFCKFKYGKFELFGGRKNQFYGLADSTLSSGSFIFSGNAMALPTVRLAIPEYLPIGFLGNTVAFKGQFAHSWFENSRTDVKNFYLHQKSLYLQIGKPVWKFKMFAGFNHNVQWAGELKFADSLNSFSNKGKLPSGFKDYLSAVTGKSFADSKDTSLSVTDAGNRIGNHLGTVDVGFEIEFSKTKLLIYRQNIYEDGSLYFLNNISDGLNGISVSFKNKQARVHLNKIVFEYLNTMSQGGSPFESRASDQKGNDSYFAHDQYNQGWVYFSNTIGTPFINKYTFKSAKGSSLALNNRVEVFYTGFDLAINKLALFSKLSYTLNKGNYYLPINKWQFSSILGAIVPLKNDIEFTSSISFDKGLYLSDNLGFSFSIRKKIWNYK